MASDLRGYTEQETLNKVLNTDNSSLQVDIVDATGVTITATDASVYVDDADWTDDTSSHTLVGGLYQSSPQSIADGKTGPLQVDADGALHISDGGNTITVDGTVSVSGLLSDGHNVTIDNASSNEVYVRGSGTAGSADTAVLTVQGIASGVAQPVSLASVPSHAVTNAGTFAVQSTLAASDGTDIGDVDVTSVVPGYAASSLGKREDDAHSNLDVGVMALAVRNDVLAALGSGDGDYAPIQANKTGALYTVEETGQLGSIFENATTVYSSKQIVAIQFLEDTKFTTLTTDSTIFPGTHADDNGIQIDNNDVFPQGMTIFGKWTAFTLASGSVIAYQGAW